MRRRSAAYLFAGRCEQVSLCYSNCYSETVGNARLQRVSEGGGGKEAAGSAAWLAPHQAPRAPPQARCAACAQVPSLQSVRESAARKGTARVGVDVVGAEGAHAKAQSLSAGLSAVAWPTRPMRVGKGTAYFLMVSIHCRNFYMDRYHHLYHP